MTLTEFLDRHNACEKGRKRAAAFPSLEDAWQNCNPVDLIWAATRPGVLTDRELRMFAVFCARSVQHLMKDPRSIAAIDVAERHANGEATDDELRAAWFGAANASAYAAGAARTASPRTACAAASARHSASASDANADALSAALSAACASASDADAIAASKQQSAWLRQNTKPNFS